MAARGTYIFYLSCGARVVCAFEVRAKVMAYIRCDAVAADVDTFL